MSPFDIVIDDKIYEFIDSVQLDGKYYVAFMDDDNTYIKEYILNNTGIELFDISDDVAQKVWEMIK